MAFPQIDVNKPRTLKNLAFRKNYQTCMSYAYEYSYGYKAPPKPGNMVNY